MSKKSQENLEEHKGQTCSAYIKTYCKAVVIKAERNWPKGKNTLKEQNQEPRKRRKKRKKKLSRYRYLIYNKIVSWHYQAVGNGQG